MRVRILFLDVDGVLNSESFILSLMYDITGCNLEHSVDPARVKMLSDWLFPKQKEEPMLTLVVISSSWRHETSLEEFNSVLKKFGLSPHILGVTPNIYQTMFENSKYRRGLEIQAWIERYFFFPFPVDLEIAIIDDDADIGFLSDYLIKTDFTEGLNQEVIQANPNPWKKYKAPEFKCLGQGNFVIRWFNEKGQFNE